VVLNAYLLPGLWTLSGPTGLTRGGLTCCGRQKKEAFSKYAWK